MDRKILNEILEYRLENGTEPTMIIVNKKDFKKWYKEVSLQLFTKRIVGDRYMGMKLIRTKDIKRGTIIVIGQ